MELLRLVIDAGLTFVACVAFIPVLIVFLQVLGFSVSRRSSEPPMPDSVRRTGFVVLMPAHNEEEGIVLSIRSALAQCGPHDRLLVVADNCSDRTAAVARAAGAEVIERHDSTRRGKGYALDFGMRWLEKNSPPSVVIVVDADCIVAPPGLERLVRRCLATGRPIQSLYLMRAPQGAVVRTKVAEFTWAVKNKLRPLGSAALGWPCQLMGTGMAFPWATIQAAALATPNLVEDMQLGLELARAGSPPLFCQHALTVSSFPVAREAVDSQRARWEHGHLGVIVGVVPRLLWNALATRNFRLMGMALDVSVPPLAAVVLSLIGLTVLNLGWWLVNGSGTPLGITFAATLLMAVNVVLAWWFVGRNIIEGRELIELPFYMLAKIPVYVRVFTKRQVEWVRTKRDDGRS